MKKLAVPIILLVLSLGVVWFASTNGDVVDGWFNNGIELPSLSLGGNKIPDGAVYICTDVKNQTQEYLYSGKFPSSISAGDMYQYKGYTYAYIPYGTTAAEMLELESSMWCIIDITDEAKSNKPLTKINGAPVYEEIPSGVE